jgi:hypothetical protein
MCWLLLGPDYRGNSLVQLGSLLVQLQQLELGADVVARWAGSSKVAAGGLEINGGATRGTRAARSLVHGPAWSK